MEKTITLTLNGTQTKVLQNALDFYSRVGIGQMETILEHPTFVKLLYDSLTPNKPIEIGAKTNRGEVVEITDEYIKTKGKWGGEEEIKEWDDIENIKYSINYSQYHKIRDEVHNIFTQGRNLLIQRDNFPKHASYGIHNNNVDESCRVAYDMVQVIRHEFWKQDSDRTPHVVSSHIHLTGKKTDNIKCHIE